MDRKHVEQALSIIAAPTTAKGLLAVCDTCGERRDGEDLNDAGRAMWLKFGAPSCFNGCGKMRTVITGAVQQVNR